MKSLILLAVTVFIGGCTLGTSSEIKRAEKMLSGFHCNKIESTQMSYSSIVSYHQHALAASHQKAEAYVKSYKAGEELFDLPLTDIIEQQDAVYQAACQSLGGIVATTNE